MNEREATELAHQIKEDGRLSPKVDQIGNGESVVKLNDRGHVMFLWGMDDWVQHKHLWSKYLYTLAMR